LHVPELPLDEPLSAARLAEPGGADLPAGADLRGGVLGRVGARHVDPGAGRGRGADPRREPAGGAAAAAAGVASARQGGEPGSLTRMCRERLAAAEYRALVVLSV